MIFRRPIFNARVQNHSRRAFVRVFRIRPLHKNFANIAQRDTELFLETHLSFENWRRTSHSRAREQCRVNAMTRRVCKCYAFPMRQLSDARLSHRRASDAGDIRRMPCFFRIKLHQTRARQRRRERAVGHVVPAPRANARGIAQPALHFVGKRDRCDQFASIRANTLRHRQRGGNVVTRMRRLLRQISVVVIEIANAASIRERRPIRRRFMFRPDDCRSYRRRKIGCDFSRDRAGFFIPRTQRAA